MNKFISHTVLAGLFLSACQPAMPRVTIKYPDQHHSRASSENFETTTLSGQLASTKGAVSHARVILENTDFQVQTDAQGYFEFKDLPAQQDYVLQAQNTDSSGKSYAVRKAVQTISPEIQLNTLGMTETGSIHGQILAPEGSDLLGAQVFIAGTPLGALSDSEGYFFLAEIPAGEHTLSVLHPDFEPQQALVLVRSGQPSLLNFTLSTPRATNDFQVIQGQVKTADNQGVPGLLVQLAGESFRAQSDEQGRFRFWQVPPGDYRLQVLAQGLLVHTEMLRVSAGMPELNLVMTDYSLPQRTQVSGRVMQSGKAIAGALIQTIPPTTETVSDEAGHYSLTLLAGAYVLTASLAQEVQVSRLVSISGEEALNIDIQGSAYAQAPLCKQENVNNININVPNAEVTVVVENQNHCTAN